MSEWHKEKIKNHIDMIMGFSFKSKDFSSSGVRLVRGDNVTEGTIRWGDKTRYWPEVTKDLEPYLLSEGDIVIGMDGSKVGRNWARITKEDVPSLLVQRVARIRTKQSLNQRFLEFLIGSDLFKQHVDSIKTGSSIPHISGGQIRDFEIPFPPLDEQESVSEILASISDKIELNQRMNETLEAMAMALFKSWFVGFDPVRAKAEGREPEGMDAATAALFPAAFNDDGLPEGWAVQDVSEAIYLNPTEKLSKGTIAPYLDMAALPTQGSWPDMPIPREFSSGSKFRNDDTLLARITPCLENGKTAYIDCLDQGQICWGSTEFIVMRAKRPMPSEYVYLLARDNAFREHALQSMTGTSGRQRVQTDSLGRFKICVPCEKVARQFGEVVKPLFRQIKANSLQQNTLSQIRDTLLPKLISGELRIDAMQLVAIEEETIGEVVEFSQKTKKPSGKANDQFREAVLVAGIVRAWGNQQYPLGNFRLQKAAYLVRRKADHDTSAHRRHAAGPYNPDMKYRGGIGIAKKKGYVQEHTNSGRKGLISGNDINAINSYLPRYDFGSPLSWVLKEFQYKSNDDLEVLTTVDDAAQGLRSEGKHVDADAIIEVIKSESKWVKKLEKPIFSKANIQRAITELAQLFPEERIV